MNKFALPAIAVAVALGAGGWWYFSQSAPTPAGTGVESASPVQAQPLDFALGNPDAPVTVVEYSSFTCPHCATFNQGPYQQLKAEFIDTDRIQYIKREVYFDRYGLWAGIVARCGGGDRYHGIASMLYEQQRDWASANDPAQVANNLRAIGRKAGMNDAELNACLEDADTALALTEFYQANAEADGIRATPTFMINGQQYQNMPYAEFERVLTEKLGG